MTSCVNIIQSGCIRLCLLFRWYFVECSWHPDIGLELWLDLQRVSLHDSPQQRAPRDITSESRFLIGRGSGVTGSNRFASMRIDEAFVGYADRARLLRLERIARGETQIVCLIDQRKWLVYELPLS